MSCDKSFFAEIGILVLLLAVTGCGCRPVGPRVVGNDLTNNIASPNGAYLLQIRGHSVDYENNGDKWWHATLTIVDASGTVVYQDPHDHATWFRLNVKWIDDNTLHVDSGDIGQFEFSKRDGQWVQRKLE